MEARSAPIYISPEVATVTSGSNVLTATSFITATSFPQTAGYLPLTTRFTQPSSCQSTLLAKQNYYLIGYQDDCYPPGHDTVIAYSPGLCPSGFEFADLEAHKSYPFSATDDPVPTTISFAYCCPSGFTYDNAVATIAGNHVEPCSSVAASGLPWPLVNATYATVNPDNLAAGSLAFLTASYNSVPTNGITSATIRASGLQVAWQSTDSAIVSLVGTSANSLNAPTASSNSGSKLSKTGIILISVLVPVLTLAMIVGGVVLFLRSRRRRQAVTEVEGKTEDSQDAAKEDAQLKATENKIDDSSEGDKDSVEAKDVEAKAVEAKVGEEKSQSEVLGEKLELSLSHTNSEGNENKSDVKQTESSESNFF